MIFQDVVDAVEAALIDEGVPPRVRELILNDVWDRLTDELQEDE